LLHGFCKHQNRKCCSFQPFARGIGLGEMSWKLAAACAFSAWTGRARAF
jgi:hypothetical protein